MVPLLLTPRGSTVGNHRFTKLGFHLLVVFWILNSFFPLQGLSIEKVVISLVLLGSVMCFVLQIIKQKEQRKLDRISTVLLGALFFWCLFTIARGVTSDSGRLFTLVANPEVGGLVWLLPFAVYIGRQPGILQALLPTFRTHAVIGLGLVVLTIASVIILDATPRELPVKVGLILFYAAPLVLLTGIGNQFDRWLNLVGLGLSAFAHYLLVNRADFALAIVVLMLALAFGRVRDFRRLSLRSIMLVALASGSILLSYESIVTKLSKDWFQDTRSFLWKEMQADFSGNDWIVGRGALGIYYSPFFRAKMRAKELGGDSPYRQVNEIGYLHIALKAGIIGIIVYFSTVFCAIRKSLTAKKTRILIGVSLILILHLFELAVVGQASFQPSRVLLWILIGFSIYNNINNE